MAQQIKDLMSTDVVTVSPDDPIQQAAQLMRDRDIGDVIVVDDERPTGIVTDRDIVVRAMADGADPTSTPVKAVCTPGLASVGPDDDVRDAVTAMTQLDVRRLPVIDNDRLVGVVTLGDLAIESDRDSVLADISAAQPNN
jgi:CBS domain-containing protein